MIIKREMLILDSKALKGPNSLSAKVTNFLLGLSSRSSKNPIHALVFIGLLASSAYLHLLNSSYSTSHAYTSNDVDWQWQRTDHPEFYGDYEHFALVIVQFPLETALQNFSDLPAPRPSAAALLVPYADMASLETVKIGQEKYVALHREKSLWRRVHDEIRMFRRLFGEAVVFDIIIMALGYLTMHLTFISLFLSMRKLGSKVWLGVSVLISSCFAFLFALIATHQLGKGVSTVLMSEGLPFLVVTIGFEKPIILTKAVLNGEHHDNVQANVMAAVKDKGAQIVRDYLVEIVVLGLGSLSQVPGLRDFCFLGSWILAFDCLLLFTFYTAILSIKLEINRIKKSNTVRKALEEEGVSKKVAQSASMDPHSAESSMMFGKNVKDSNVFRFKILMVSGFLLINVLNVCSPPFRHMQASGRNTIAQLAATLDAILEKRDVGTPLLITILPPVHYIPFEQITPTSSAVSQVEVCLFRFTEAWSRIVGDPVLSKSIVFALAISVGLNAYLFSAARKLSAIPVKVMVPKMPGLNKSSNSTPVTPESDLDEMLQTRRTFAECERLLKSGKVQELHDEEIVKLSLQGKIAGYALEKVLKDSERAVRVRRAIVSRTSNTQTLEKSLLPYKGYDYDTVMGACCENVIGFMPLPIGVAGPLKIDGKSYYIPLATTEGCLVAGAMRGCKAINAGGGAVTIVTKDGMTRGPCVAFSSLLRAGAAVQWLDSERGQRIMKKAFNSTSRFARLQSLKTAVAGTKLFIRFCTTTGDAMGMNMISKGVECALKVMSGEGFSDMHVVSVSGNYCTDKKPAAINWIEGRGKSVVAEAIIPADVVQTVLKTEVDALVSLNHDKNLVGSAMAGSLGGFNAHAANLVTSIFLATGQDPAQNVESSFCLTDMKNINGNLQITVSMPCIEVGTLGGGTILEPQAAVLEMLGVRGPHPQNAGDNARQLARIVAAGVLAGELSLCAALCAGHLVQSHMALNRSQPATRASTPQPLPVLHSQSGIVTPVSPEGDVSRLNPTCCIRS